MKKLWRLLSACAFVLGIVSCSNFSESSSLSLTFNGSDFARNSLARNISVSSDYEGYYIVASVLGDYRETKSLKITSGGTYTIEFNSVPVGSKIYVEANVYNPNAVTKPGATSINSLHIFTGTSEKQTVYAGENIISLTMENLVPNEYPTLTLYGNGNENMGNFKFECYRNGKYQVKFSDAILSEGLWSASSDAYNRDGFNANAVVRIKECAYKTYTNADNSGVNGLSDLIIVERPVWSSFTVATDISGDGYLPIGDTKVF